MQVILGAGGAIGKELAAALPSYGTRVRIFGRKPAKVNEADELVAGNLLDPAAVQNAVRGCEVAYLTAGLPYKLEVWRKDWPVIMANVIEACLQHNCRLVFFDNIYMYDRSVLSNMTESAVLNPPSQKGKVRAEIAGMLMNAVQTKGLRALIARCADFYGPGVNNVSVLIETVFKPLARGEKANLLASDNFRHTYTYTVDAGKATALLGNTPEAFGEIWHLPTAGNAPTGKGWVEAIASELGVRPRYRVVGKTMTQILGIFMPVMKESVEMLYQYDRDYVFNSKKFEDRFNFVPTSYSDGIREVVGAGLK